MSLKLKLILRLRQVAKAMTDVAEAEAALIKAEKKKVKLHQNYSPPLVLFFTCVVNRIVYG